MTEKKQRQGQWGSIPKTICPKCDKEYLTTAFGTKTKKLVRVGQYCPNPACDYIVKDFVELDEGENVEKGKDFAEACCDQRSLKELKAALAGEANETDMKIWNLTDDQWHEALEVAIIAMENNLSVDEAIKCISFS
jgi:hypothetical protein